MTIVLLRHAWPGRIVSCMAADTVMLARLLSMAALIAATTKYAEVIKRRVVRRADARERAVFEERGLRGLVRVFLADAGRLEVPPGDDDLHQDQRPQDREDRGGQPPVRSAAGVGRAMPPTSPWDRPRGAKA